MDSSNVVRLLTRVRAREQSAISELMPLVYDELHRMARSFMRAHVPNHTLQPTALVNEAYVKLFADGEREFADRAHFLAVMACAMRQVLVDYARSAGAAKRGGRCNRVTWDTNIQVKAGPVYAKLKLLELNTALDALGRENPRFAEVVEMSYFGGMTAEEIAEAAFRSVHVVRHELRLARAWLRRELAR